MSRTTTVRLDDDHWFWAYDVSLAILAVEVLDVLKAGAAKDEPWLDEFRYHLTLPVLVQGTYGLDIPSGLTDGQRAQLVELFAEAERRLRARRQITAAEAAERYVVDQTPVFLRAAPVVDTSPVADLADAVIHLIRGDLPPPPPGHQRWFYGTDDGPRGIGRPEPADGR
ncbi:hypothetical protein ACTMTJ_13740 [Phytohabitans sp. LJ34]|uniref:hypothetical protein n=1 Tax=Phytohabitans sp. LJ34 TaxID=3452217 RepID=UPI003F8C963E